MDNTNADLALKLRGHVEFLTEIKPARNYRHIQSLDKAASYIYDALKLFLGQAAYQEFTDDGNTYRNVIARYGKGEEKLIIGAHYDVDGSTPGADDNASAVAGLLEVARLLSKHKPDLSYQIEFIGFTLEESPFFRGNKMGSFIHAKSLKDANAKVKAMVCLEMIGYYSDEPNSQRYPHPDMLKIFPSIGNFIGVIGKEGQEWLVKHMATHITQSAKIPVESIAAPPGLNEAIALSDHINYWKHGFESVMINDTSFYRNPNYHRLSDTIDTLNFNKMAEVVKGVYAGIVKF
ncbi:MAG: M28 family peptidase [Sphingobacteriales bacterium]|nr:MAG: M28 family peptidase [Sphingobacteriales bacterium]